MDNLRTGTLENVAHLEDEADFEYIDHDITTHINLPGKLDEIYHFASPASPADFERIPIMIPNFISQAFSGRPLTIYGDGSHTRSVQYIDDLIEGTFRLMKRRERRPVNIGNPVEYSVREVAEMVLELSGSDSELVHEPLPRDDPRQRCPDITRAKETLSWEPHTPAREGLQKTLSWFAERKGHREGAPAGRTAE
jgi:nucleoside-diphosphate-sugar epimerase